MTKHTCDENQVLVSIARHPIFDESRRVWGYELFCVGGPAATLSGFPEDDRVAVSVASSAYIGLQQILAREKKVLVNFNEKSILDHLPYALPPVLAAVKVSEHVFQQPAVPDLLAQLKADGYLIAVSGYSGRREFTPLYQLADIIGVQVEDKTKEALNDALATIGSLKSTLLACRVKDARQFKMCQELGFSLFQGPFFKLPEILTIRKLSSNEMARFTLLKMIETDEPDIEMVAENIQADVSISFRLLAYLNSAAFGFAQKIKSIQHAIAILGWHKIRTWLRVVLLNDMSHGTEAPDLLMLAAQRGKFLELIAKDHDYWGFNPESLHLLGLFSLLDTMLGAPMAEIVTYLPLEDKLKAALCREPNNEYYPLVTLAQYFEEARWPEAEAMVQQLNLDSAKVKAAFQAAIDWAGELTTLHNAKPDGK